MKKQSNNKGFTLAELIIAVAIMGIVFGPIISNFVQSSRINKKAREELAATTMAQNIMEGMNVYESEDVIKSFETYKTGEQLSLLPAGITCESYGENQPGKLVVNTTTGVSGVSDYCTISTDVTTNPDGSQTVTGTTPTNVLMRDDHKYEFFVKNVYNQLNGNDNNKYDLRVTVDASNHHKENDANPDKYNDVAGISFATVNGVYDCVYQDKASDMDSAVEKLRLNVSRTETNEQEVADHLKRTMKVRIYNKNEGDPSKAPDYCVKFINTYSSRFSKGVSFPYEPWWANVDFDFGTVTEEGPDKYSSKNTAKNPRNIYIYYWPNYTDAAHCDEITIDNEAGIKVDIYLIRMQAPENASAYLKETTYSYENGYTMKLKLKANFKNVAFGDMDGSDAKYELLRDSIMTVHTNVYENIAKEHSANLEIKGNDLHMDARCELDFSEYTDKNGNLLSSTQKDEIILGLEGKTTREKIYEIKVEVFEAGAKDEDFPEEKKLTEFTGGATK